MFVMAAPSWPPLSHQVVAAQLTRYWRILLLNDWKPQNCNTQTFQIQQPSLERNYELMLTVCQRRGAHPESPLRKDRNTG